MTIPKASQEAREAAALLAEASQVWCNIGGNDVAAIRNGYWDDSHDDIGALVQSFAQFEQLIRSMVIDEAAGVLKRARDEIERLEYPYIGESAASVIADIDASIRQLGERGRG